MRDDGDDDDDQACAVFDNLDSIQEINKTERSICCMASDWLSATLPARLKERYGLSCDVFDVTSSVRNGSFHIFNMVAIEGRPSVICDLTAAQFFTRPMDAFGGYAYFVGTRQELSGIVSTVQQQTEAEIKKSFPSRPFRSLWDVDYWVYHEDGFGSELVQFLNKKATTPCLCTQSLYYAMDVTWGDKRSFLMNNHGDADFRAAVSCRRRCAGIVDLVEEKDPPIPNLVTPSSVRLLSLKDGPC